MAKKSLSIRVVTSLDHPARVSYFHGLVGQLVYNKKKKIEELSYSSMVLIPKTDTKTISAFSAAMKEVVQDYWPEGRPDNLKVAFRDGDKQGVESGGVSNSAKAGSEPYGGHFFFTARSGDKPNVVDHNLQPFLDAGAVVSGDYCIVSANCYAYDNEFGRGVTFSLGNIQLVKKGEPLGGSPISVEDEFKPIAGAAKEEVPVGAGSVSSDPDDIFNM